MADTSEYLSVYKKFFDDFAATVDPDDQLPVKVAAYNLYENEIVGEVVDWTLQYLNQKNCPTALVAPITRTVLDEIRQMCKNNPELCGYSVPCKAFQPLRLMQTVVARVNEVCLRYGDNGRVLTLPPPRPGIEISTCAIKNTRRLMEDRHVIVQDFHGVFGIKDPSPASYYAVFDGHAGTDAAVYSVSHLHQFLAESPYYPSDPAQAIKDAFFRTDSLFIEKCKEENLHSGTTAVCALIRPKDKKLYVAWLGDSQAVLVSEGRVQQMVNPHKPNRQDEKERIETMGGCVLFFGTWRVDGQLAVSRAIGDSNYKPYVCAEADVREVSLDGTEDFLILACDGLWDFVSTRQAAKAVYDHLANNPDDIEGLSEQLVRLSKENGSTDNISVIVALLRPVSLMDTTLLMQKHPLFDDLGPETSVDDLSGASDVELQRQQLADLDPDREPRQETPTPPADSLPGQTEPDNVAESGDDSEDEWDYIKVKPNWKQVDVDLLVQTNSVVCQKTSPDDSVPFDESDMESQLNPDAAEFVPSPTQSKPSVEEILLSKSPEKPISLDNVVVPSQEEFDKEVSSRPGDVNERDRITDFMNGQSGDTISNEEITTLPPNLGGAGDAGFSVNKEKSFTANDTFESEISSTKAEFGDESAFLAGADFSGFQKDSTFTSNTSVVNVDNTFTAPKEFVPFSVPDFPQDFTKNENQSLHISFEVQKEIVPKMVEGPEHVKISEEVTNPFGLDSALSDISSCDLNLSMSDKNESLIQSFENNGKFTPEAYEIQTKSPLNPCAPSFSFEPLENQESVSTLTESTNKVLEPAIPSREESSTDQGETNIAQNISICPTSPEPGHVSPYTPEAPTPDLQQSPTDLEAYSQDVLAAVSPVPDKETVHNFEDDNLHSPEISALTEESPAAVTDLTQSLPLQTSSPVKLSCDTPQRVEENMLNFDIVSAEPEKIVQNFGNEENIPKSEPIERDLMETLDSSLSSTQNESKVTDNDSKSNDMTSAQSEPLREKELIEDLDIFKTNLKPDYLIGEQKDMVETMLKLQEASESLSSAGIESNVDITASEQTSKLSVSVNEVPPCKELDDTSDVLQAAHTPPPTPSQQIEQPPLVVSENKTIEEAAVKLVDSDAVTTAVTVAGTVAAAVAAGAVLDKKVDSKKELPGTTTKKITKAPAKTQPSRPSPVTNKPANKVSPTSPTKPSPGATTQPLRTSVPRKPLQSKVTSTPKVTKALTSTTPTTSPAPITKPRTPVTTQTTTTRVKPSAPITSTVTKSRLVNGDSKKAAETKGAEGIAKRTIAPTARTSARPLTAPRTKSPTPKPSVPLSKPKPSSTAVNGIASKPRPTSTVSAAQRVKSAPAVTSRTITDKQVKETANKQISSSRVTSSASATNRTTTTKKIESKVTNRLATKTSPATGVTKSSSTTTTTTTVSNKMGTKRPIGVTRTTTTTKSNKIITAEKNDLISIHEGSVTNEVKSDQLLIESIQPISE